MIDKFKKTQISCRTSEQGNGDNLIRTEKYERMIYDYNPL